ncbi:Putative cyclin-B3-1 [Linum perenne]
MVTTKRRAPLRPSQHTVDSGNSDLLPDSQKIIRALHVLAEARPQTHAAASTCRRPFVPSGTGNLSIASTSSKVYSKIGQNIKDKNDKDVKVTVRRKALADVSNVGRSFQKAAGSKPLVSTSSNSRIVNSKTRKPSLGILRDNPSQGVGDPKSQSKCGIELGSSSNNARNKTRIPKRVSISNSSSRSSSVLMTSFQGKRRDSKENDKGSDKTQKTGSFTVKPKLGKKIVAQVGKGSGQLRRNRASEGSVPAATSSRHVYNTSNKSLRPLAKTAIEYSYGYKAARSKVPANTENPSSIAAITSAENNTVVAACVMESVPKMVSSELSDRETSFDAEKTSMVDLDIISNKKSRRRRSYTSLLMTRSKLLEEHRILPSIDDNCNQLDVAEYVDDIYQYYWSSEGHNKPLGSYMSTQPDITPQMRGVLINWLIEVHSKFQLMQETLYLMITLLDQYLSQVQIKKNELQLVGLTALLLASKYEDFWHPRIKDLISISAEVCTQVQMLEMEKIVLRKLKFRLNFPTTYVFTLRFLKAAQSESKLQHMVSYLTELCLVEYEALKFKPSMISASAVFVARCTLKIDPAWTPLLTKHARYDVSQLRECAEMILKFQKAARTSSTKVTYEKFLSPALDSVARVKPLDKLPH